MNRRTFIALLASATSSFPMSTLAKRRQAQGAVSAVLHEPWQTINEVQQHLFPADEQSPGALDIQALPYLQAMMMAVDISDAERDRIKQGAGWLNDLCVQIHQRPFIELDSDNRESILRKIEQSRAGSRWLSLLMTYLIEALLSDPIYGGNTNGQGWQWLQHQPGYPTPTADKRYFKLGHVVQRRTKA